MIASRNVKCNIFHNRVTKGNSCFNIILNMTSISIVDVHGICSRLPPSLFSRYAVVTDGRTGPAIVAKPSPLSLSLSFFLSLSSSLFLLLSLSSSLFLSLSLSLELSLSLSFYLSLPFFLPLSISLSLFISFSLSLSPLSLLVASVVCRLPPW
jgi:hypothetical protein